MVVNIIPYGRLFFGGGGCFFFWWVGGGIVPMGKRHTFELAMLDSYGGAFQQTRFSLSIECMLQSISMHIFVQFGVMFRTCDLKSFIYLFMLPVAHTLPMCKSLKQHQHIFI